MGPHGRQPEARPGWDCLNYMRSFQNPVEISTASELAGTSYRSSESIAFLVAPPRTGILLGKIEAFTMIVARHLPEACNPRRHCPPTAILGKEEAQYRCELMTAGTMDVYRAADSGASSRHCRHSAIREHRSECKVICRTPVVHGRGCVRPTEGIGLPLHRSKHFNTRHHSGGQVRERAFVRGRRIRGCRPARGTAETEKFFRPGSELHAFCSAKESIELVQLVQEVIRRPQEDGQSHGG